ncbi:neuroligin-4, X-linked-like [Sitophilus oryzae]|uniref:Neuroligin-4, X-linked-like n=2 Tax=Sitophilus oryzae TaxID=7048 RepID=A0A6J2YCM5_SITOR|nr:neuroligin-4, X-linked-like [Sitophilus oryzae]
MIVRPRNSELPWVEVYRGIPYAAPPIGHLRFMPPSSTLYTWQETKYAYEFGPVCPQKFPDESTMTEERKRYFLRLKKYLLNESEDCLYLNIYAPYQESSTHSRTYPVIVYLHGESFEWNSGNPYDGSVLAAYGKVIVITLNFRLGILGFLKVEPEEAKIQSNFGLVDQLAALLWIKANIEAFGGDPTKVTLMGHGTGAVCASLLTISPMAIHEGKKLFHRAILMSGTALADWAVVSKPLDISIQVAQSLNCQLHDNFSDCLRRKRLDQIMSSAAVSDPYRTTFGPVVDNIFVPNDPKKSMAQYTDIFKRFELMYGVTELESIHLPLGGDTALIHGMFEEQKDEELSKYMRTRCEIKPNICFLETRAKYKYDANLELQRDQDRYRHFAAEEPDRASLARDELLDILSDARTVASVIQTGLYHSALNIQSYFYVFTHKTQSKQYIRNKTYNGEELPYVFGVPVEGPKFHFQDGFYTEDEKRFSMTVMRYLCNFAYTGNPNVPKNNYPVMEYDRWHQFDKEWLPFDENQQNYLQLGIPIRHEQFYRKEQMEYWNNLFPNISKHISSKNPLPWVHHSDRLENFNNFDNFNKSLDFELDKIAQMFGPSNSRGRANQDVYGKVITAPPAPPEEVKQSVPTLSVLLVVGVLFLFANLIIFVFLYYKCIKNKKNHSQVSPEEHLSEEQDQKVDSNILVSTCNMIRFCSKPSKEDGDYDDVDIESKNVSKNKLTRVASNSTIDAHAKVRDWIASEIVLKYSPKEKRKNKKDKSKVKSKTKTQEVPIHFPVEENTSIDKCPTRPVSPIEECPITKSLLIKTASIDRSNHRRRPDKVSVAIDATPAGRGPSVLMQQPIELSKSVDYPGISPGPLRRSLTVEDFSPRRKEHCADDLRKSITSINLNNIETEPTIIRIEHGHSKSDPVQDLDYQVIKRLRTFDPNAEVNVTSRDENMETVLPLSPEEALMTIKRRNFPKVLPDHPGREAFLSKRRSMPVHNIYAPINEGFQYSNSEPYSPTGRNFMRFPPMPPPRTTTLGRQGSNPQPICLSEPTLAEEPPSSPEPEVACNNLYVGPLIPKNKQDAQKSVKIEARSIPRAIITTNPNNPIKRPDPKVIVKPTINKNKNDSKYIPRVVVPDNRPEIYSKPSNIVNKDLGESVNEDDRKLNEGEDRRLKKSQIPTLVKSSNVSLNKDSSSSESNSPSSESSDTGTVVKKVYL